jgi:hypothetical protein
LKALTAEKAEASAEDRRELLEDFQKEMLADAK